MFFNNNLKFLRQRRGRTQDEVAIGLEMKRSTLSGYENGVAEPGLRILGIISEYYRISIDLLIKTDLSSLPESKISEIERGSESHLQGKKIRILASTVDRKNKDNIEIVSLKAKAGYPLGFNDPEYISELQTCQLPFLPRERKYRIFQISGDSMFPIPDKSWITTEYCMDWTTLKNNTLCILIIEDDGIVFKSVINNLRSDGSLILKSLNPDYKPYEIASGKILEVWKFVHYITSELNMINSDSGEILKQIINLREEINELKIRKSD